MFTVASAITRLTSGPVNVFGDRNLTSAQQLQRINEVLEFFYDEGTWRGVQATVPITSTGGIITLSATYQRMDGLVIPQYGRRVAIKSQSWAFSPNSTAVQDWTQYSNLLAIDMGDNGSGQRQYQLTGDPTQLDALAFTALLRKRFTWITDTGTTVIPDSFEGLRKGILAFRAMDQMDTDLEKTLKVDALQLLNGSLQEFESEDRQMHVQEGFGMGSFQLTN